MPEQEFTDYRQDDEGKWSESTDDEGSSFIHFSFDDLDDEDLYDEPFDGIGTSPAPRVLDTWSSASRQHFIDTGEYLSVGEVIEAPYVRPGDISIPTEFDG
jgi:hypothetical protein